MKLIHTHSYPQENRLERLASGRYRRRLRNRQGSGFTPTGTGPNGNSPKKAA